MCISDMMVSTVWPTVCLQELETLLASSAFPCFYAFKHLLSDSYAYKFYLRNEFHVSDVYPSVNYIGSRAK